MFRALAVSLALLPNWGAQAGSDRISVLLGSHHVNAEVDYNEVNPGLIATWEREFDYSVGVYYNSYNAISPMVAVGYNWELADYLEVGLFGGVAYYGDDADSFTVSAGGLVPLGGAQLRYKNAFMQLIPAGGEDVDAVITFGLTFAIGGTP